MINDNLVFIHGKPPESAIMLPCIQRPENKIKTADNLLYKIYLLPSYGAKFVR